MNTTDLNFNEKVDNLSGLLKICSEDCMELLFSASFFDLKPNQVLFQQGAVADHCFFVLSGFIKIESKLNYCSINLSLIGPGEFGGLVLMSDLDSYFPANVVSLVNSSVVCIPKSMYKKTWIKNKIIKKLISNNIQSRMLDFQFFKKIENVCLEKKILHFLQRYYFEKKYIGITKLARKDLASLLSVKTETLIRALAQLSKKNILDLSQGDIKIKNLNEFKKLLLL